MYFSKKRFTGEEDREHNGTTTRTVQVYMPDIEMPEGLSG